MNKIDIEVKTTSGDPINLSNVSIVMNALLIKRYAVIIIHNGVEFRYNYNDQAKSLFEYTRDKDGDNTGTNSFPMNQFIHRCSLISPEDILKF